MYVRSCGAPNLRMHCCQANPQSNPMTKPKPKSMFRRVLHVVILCVAVFAFMGAGDEARFNDLGHRLMCVCGCNYVLLECNHVGCPNSDRMRSELAANIDHGDSDDRTLQTFVEKYGPVVLLAPTAKGFDRVAWIMPFLALALGLLTTIFIVLAWKKKPALTTPGGVLPVSGAELERFRTQARKDTEI